MFLKSHMYEQFNFVKMGGFRSGYIGGDMEFGVPMLIVLGSIFSSWAYALLSVALFWVLFYRIDPLIYIPLANTIIILTVSTSIALYYGVKNRNTKLIHTYYMAKIFECFCTIAQAVLCFCTFNSFWPMGFCGVFMLPCGVYLTVCVRKIYNDIKVQTVTDSAFTEPITEKPIIQKI